MAEETNRVEPTIGDNTGTTAAAVAKKPSAAEIPEQSMVGATNDLPASSAPVVKKPMLPEQQQDNEQINLPAATKNSKTLNQIWGITPDMNALAPYVHGDGISTQNDTLRFKMKNGDKVDWAIKTRQDGSSFESISFDRGMFGLAGFTQESADGIAAVGLAKGWKSMAVQGHTLDEKEKMWLAGESKGLSVTNFQPLPDSKIWEQLKQRNPERFEELRKPENLEPVGATNEIPASSSKFAAPKQDDAQQAAPKAADLKAPEAAAKPTFNQWLDTRAAEAKSPTEAEGFKIMSRAVASGAIKLDELEQKSIQTNYKPKVREGVMEADGKGYNRVVEIFKAKGVDAPQKVPEQEIIAAAPKVSAPAAPKA